MDRASGTRATGAVAGRGELVNIIPEDTLKKKTEKAEGDDYHNKPALREILSRLEGVSRA